MVPQVTAAPGIANSSLADTYDHLTLPEMFHQTVQRQPAKTALMAKRDGAYKEISFAELQDRVHQFTSALIENGIQPGDRVALLSENRPEWVISDLGILQAGAANVPIYPSLTAHQIAHLLRDSGSRLLVLSHRDHLQKIQAVEDELPGLEGVIVLDNPDDPKLRTKLWRWQEFLDLGRRHLDKNRAEIAHRVAHTGPEDLASIVYTSGTTGEPKGAMLTHRNFVSNCVTASSIIGYVPGDIELSILPLCHVLERVVYYCGLYTGATIAYAESFDTVPANLLEIRPTMVAAVPRLFEKIHGRVLEGVEKSSLVRRQVFQWAMAVGRRRRQVLQRRGSLPRLLAMLATLAHRLVFSKLHERVGGHIRYFVSGGAPLRQDIAEFFADVGLIILEGYGLTETSPAITFNRPHNYRFGTVGQPIADVEVKVAEDGEILARGPNIMKGYWNKPQATAQAIDPEGWFHTGDIGVLDREGFLAITDRKKELLVLSNGKNVAPQPIENMLQASPFIEQAVVIGDNRNFVSALIVPAFAQLQIWARQRDITGTRVDDLLDRSEVRALLQTAVDKANRELARFEQIKKFTLISRELTQDQNELTPTLKFKRRIILEHFKDQIEVMYQG